ncbi:MAG: DUF5320 domain-containing protein [Clostridia bacterium]|nr:DUF5320 domain-containing protein [Clostridia bacterium]
MPGFDGTGPSGQGPITGRGRGYCVVPITDTYNSAPVNNSTTYTPSVYPKSDFLMRRAYPLGIRRLGRGRGRGFARRRWL